MTLKKQVRVIRALNKLSEKFKGLINKREIPKVRR